MDYLNLLLNTDGFPKRWNCGSAWTPLLGWTHIISDIVIFLSYITIPVILAYFIFIRKDFPFSTIFILFISFIFLCGIGHLIEASIFWHPWYRLAGLNKFLTAVVSVFTAFALMGFIPKILKLPRFINLQFQTIFQKAPDPILITDDKDCIMMANPAALSLFGYNEDDIVGQHIDILLPTGVESDFSKHLKKKNKDLVNTWVNLAGKDRRTIPVNVSRTDIDFEDKNEIVYMVKDVTFNIETEKKREAYAKKLETINKELNSFVYVASHDLKSPLRAIDSLAKFIHEDCYDKLPDDSKTHLNKISARIEHMEELLESLLVYSRAGKSRQKPEAVDTHKLVHAIFDDAGAPDDYTFEVQGQLPSIFTEKMPITQVLQNIITNAVKYRDHEKAGKLLITSQDKGDFVEISLSDNGIGIAPEYHDKVFQVFERLQVTSDREGTGIGLAIVKKTCESVGGSIRIDPDYTQGSRFIIHWPKIKMEMAS